MPKQVQNALTPVAVRSAKPGRYADGGGLYLLVKPSGARSWLFRATADGKVRDVGLGSAGAGGVSLAAARELARDKARLVREGSVPISDRRQRVEEAKARGVAAAATTTFRTVATDLLALREESWRNDKHRAQWGSTLATYAYPHLGDMPVAAIGTEHVLAALQPIWRDKPETAGRVRGRIEAVLNAAKVKGLRSGDNPARWRGHLDQLLPAVTSARRAKHQRLGRTGHHAAVAYADVPAFIAALREREGTAALALEFAVLCASRSGEVRGATWVEIDLDAAVWTVPAARMKAGREHRVPLSPRAIAILRLAGVGGMEPAAPVFRGAGKGCLSIMALAMVMRRMGRSETVHGFRSAFRDWAAETTGFPHEVCEMALAHTIANKAEAAYRRGDLFEKRRKLMDAWAGYCAGTAAAGAKVTPIRRAADR